MLLLRISFAIVSLVNYSEIRGMDRFRVATQVVHPSGLDLQKVRFCHCLECAVDIRCAGSEVFLCHDNWRHHFVTTKYRGMFQRWKN